MKLFLCAVAILAFVAASNAARGLQSKTFPNTVDHFGRDTTTFSHRYFVNEDNFYGGGPIFIYISGRLDSFELLQLGDVAEFNAQVNGIIFGLEHRFFGASKPTPNTSNANLKFLSVEQAVADIASFVQYIKDNYVGVKYSKVILFGEEYGAALAVWARQKFPHLIGGVWASSAYVNPIVDHTQLAENIGKIYRQIGGDRCYDALENAFVTLELLVWLNESSAIKEHLNLCNDVLIEDEYDLASLFANLVQLIQNKLQSHSYGEIESSCDLLTGEEGTDFERFSKWLTTFLYPNVYCFNLSARDMVKQFNTTSWESVGTAGGDRQQLYLHCAGLGQFATAGSAQQPFGKRFGLDKFKQFCDAVFGDGFTDTIDFQNKKLLTAFGGIDLGVTNVYFTNGEFDPKFSLGVVNDLNKDAPATVIPMVTSGKDLRPGTANPALRAVKDRAKVLMLKWINDMPTEEAAMDLLRRFGLI